MALAPALHHSADKTTRVQLNAPRGQKNAGTEHFELSEEDVVSARGSQPPCLGDLRGPQDKVQQRTMEPIADDVPMLTLLDSPVPQMVYQLVAVLARYDMPLADQVIEVPKVSCAARCGRTVLCTPQTAEQLVEVPTILSSSFLRMLQNVDTPVPGRGREVFKVFPKNGIQQRLVEQNIVFQQRLPSRT